MNHRVLLLVLIFAVSVVGLSMGATLPLVSLRLMEAGASSLEIGVLSAMPAAGMILAAFLVAPLCRRLSGRGLYLGCFVLCSLAVAALELPASTPLLVAARLLLGVAMGVVVILGESWVNLLCDEARRGQVVAFYAACFTGCQLGGPALIGLLGAQSPWLVALVVLANLLALAAVARGLPGGWGQAAEDEVRTFSLAGFLRVAPALCTGVLFFAFFDAVVLSLFPVYASAHGYAVGIAALMVTVILAGDMVCQVPLGWLSDRTERSRLHLVCGVAALGIGMALPWLITRPTLLWPALVLLGAVAGGVYTLALVRIGERFNGQDLVTANACVGMLWGIGSLVGPLLSGALMGTGPHGLPLALSLAAAMFVATALTGQRRLAERAA
ncbi:L-Proline/Glycine betaine transporter ProP [Pseudomonas sp. FeS53a]|uniref:MFS transporter n=1 Tax=Pseudomonas sp. FeS53a TaxID=1604022 RepID=UPI0005C9B52D|nr:MFS transporter [Pseudomonas sp. FeS53a]KIV65553.1 L-Proline/Glycine betaine transporter ProP [Pseudomonas sp. FeS53a]